MSERNPGLGITLHCHQKSPGADDWNITQESATAPPTSHSARDGRIDNTASDSRAQNLQHDEWIIQRHPPVHPQPFASQAIRTVSIWDTHDVPRSSGELTADPTVWGRAGPIAASSLSDETVQSACIQQLSAVILASAVKDLLLRGGT